MRVAQSVSLTPPFHHDAPHPYTFANISHCRPSCSRPQTSTLDANRAHPLHPSSRTSPRPSWSLPGCWPSRDCRRKTRRLPQLAIASMPKQEEGRPNVQQDIPNRPRNLTEVSRAVLRSEQAKRWTKKYRTEVAASSSSLLSTFAAVRGPVYSPRLPTS